VNQNDIKALPPERLFVVIDGSSYLFRAFYSPNLKELTSPEGDPSGAIYGVLNMLTRLSNIFPILNSQNKQCYSAIVFDAKGGSFRNQLYSEYKANRGEPPESLISQIEPLHKIITALGWKLLSIAGVEADDVIASLVKQAKINNISSVIVTGDKDFAQLVDQQVYLFDSMKNYWIDTQAVNKKFGVMPNQILDYLSLIGDSSDNVPGVDKVGPKTAVKWLSEYGNLANIIENSNEIGGVVGENLRATINKFPLIQQLIALKDDVDIKLEFKDLKVDQPDNNELNQWYSKFGFKKFLAELQSPSLEITQIKPDIQQNQSNDQSLIQSKLTTINQNHNKENQPIAEKIKELTQKHHYQFTTITNIEQLQSWLNQITPSSLVAIDTETTGLKIREHELVGISLAISAANAIYIPITYQNHANTATLQNLSINDVAKALAPILYNPQIKKCGHNIKFDRHFLAKYGLNLIKLLTIP